MKMITQLRLWEDKVCMYYCEAWHARVRESIFCYTLRMAILLIHLDREESEIREEVPAYGLPLAISLYIPGTQSCLFSGWSILLSSFQIADYREDVGFFFCIAGRLFIAFVGL